MNQITIASQEPQPSFPSGNWGPTVYQPLLANRRKCPTVRLTMVPKVDWPYTRAQGSGIYHIAYIHCHCDSSSPEETRPLHMIQHRLHSVIDCSFQTFSSSAMLRMEPHGGHVLDIFSSKLLLRCSWFILVTAVTAHFHKVVAGVSLCINMVLLEVVECIRPEHHHIHHSVARIVVNKWNKIQRPSKGRRL